MILPLQHRIGLGTYLLGAQTYDACRTALELGYRHLDTAALYRNEEAVAQAMADSGVPREEIFLVSKIQVRDILSPHRLLPAAQQRVALLGRVDLLLLHAPVGDWAQAWALLQEAATWPQVGAVGVSNFDVAHLQTLSEPLPLWNQIELSPFLPRRELVAFCQERGIQIVAHSSLTKGQRLDHPTLQQIAQRHAATPAQILIAWALAQGFAVLPRSANRQHQEENLAAQNIQLSSEDMGLMTTLADGYATHPQWL